MAGLSSALVRISGQGRSGLGQALAGELRNAGASVTFENGGCRSAVDIAVSVYGRIAIYDDPYAIPPSVVADMIEENYLKPRTFVERHIDLAMCARLPCHILVMGSNAALYGNTWAIDYAAMKSAMNKYLELRRRTVRDAGIRLTMINFGAISTSFWENAARENGDKPEGVDPLKALSAIEAARTVRGILELPEGVAVHNALVTSLEYQ